MACDSSIIVVGFIMLTTSIVPLHAVNEKQNLLGVKGENVSLRIINGFITNITEFPYVVSIQDATLHQQLKYVCGGALLSRVWVMTAAHCLVDKSPEKTLVRAGSDHCDSGGILIPVDQFYVHPLYDEDHYDFGLIKMKQLQSYDTVKLGIVELPKKNVTFPLGTMFLVCGWGETSPGASLESPCALRAVYMPKTKDSECALDFHSKGDNVADQFCAGYEDIKMGTCNGDSGGPLTLNNTLFGIVSGGSFFCDSVTIFSKVSVVRGWISLHTGL